MRADRAEEYTDRLIAQSGDGAVTISYEEREGILACVTALLEMIDAEENGGADDA